MTHAQQLRAEALARKAAEAAKEGIPFSSNYLTDEQALDLVDKAKADEDTKKNNTKKIAIGISVVVFLIVIIYYVKK